MAEGHWIKTLTTVLAPTTTLVALLYYFGYVRTAALYAQFGLDIGTLQLSSQEYVLRSADALFVPLGCLLLFALVAVWIHWAVQRQVTSRSRAGALRAAAIGCIGLGVCIFVVGLGGVVFPAFGLYLVTPLSIGIGALLIGLGASVESASRRARPSVARSDLPRFPQAAGVIVVFGFVVLSLFWTTNEYAQAYGRGRAETLSQQLAQRPRLILDTRDRLFADAPGVQETALPDGGTYRFRYRGFRLLMESHGSLFLIPEGWTRGHGAILVLPRTEAIRTQFIAP